MSSVEELKKFAEMGKELLKHKYLYYVKAEPELSDYDYDLLEKAYCEMGKALKAKGCPEPDVHLVAEGLWDEDVEWWLPPCSVVGFPDNHPWAESVKESN